MNVQTFHYLGTMGLDSLDAQPQIISNLLGRTATGDSLQNFPLPWAKRFESGFGIRRPDIGMDDLTRNSWT